MGCLYTKIQVEKRRRAHVQQERSKHKVREQCNARAIDAGGIGVSLFCIDNDGIIDDFYFIEQEKIGEGSFGRVSKCINKSTGNMRAVKCLRKTKRKSIVETMRRELMILRQLDHPNIARLYEFFEDNTTIYMVLQLCGGEELFDRVLQAGHFSEVQTAMLMAQLFRAVRYMHFQQVAHRDLKTENLMLMSPSPVEQNTLKIIDFGSAKQFETGDQFITRVGSPYFIAPQVLGGQYTEACDMWTSGVVMYILLCGYPPFYGESDAAVLAKVRIGSFYFNAADFSNVSEQAKSIIRGLLKVSVAARLTARQALNHEWLAQKAPPQRAPIKMRYIDNMRRYGKFSLLKKAVLQIMAATLDEEYTKPLIDTFTWIDRSGEGLISHEELRIGLKRGGFEDSAIPEDLDNILDKIDTDGSGEIEISEFVAAALDARIYTRAEFCWAAFRLFDQSCDGSVNCDDLHRLLNNHNRDESVSEEVCQQLIEEADEDADGALNFEEFIAMMKGATKQKKAVRKKANGEGGGEDGGTDYMHPTQTSMAKELGLAPEYMSVLDRLLAIGASNGADAITALKVKADRSYDFVGEAEVEAEAEAAIVAEAEAEAEAPLPVVMGDAEGNGASSSAQQVEITVSEFCDLPGGGAGLSSSGAKVEITVSEFCDLPGGGDEREDKSLLADQPTKSDGGPRSKVEKPAKARREDRQKTPKTPKSAK